MLQCTADGKGNVTFTITHNSDYFVADTEISNTTVDLPKTGSPVDMNFLLGLGALLVIGGSCITFRRKPTVK